MHIVPARAGINWLKSGWALFRKTPASWIALTVLLLIASGLINLVPWAGPALATMLIPGFSVSFMIASREAEKDAPLQAKLLLEGFRQGRAPLIKLGGLYLICMLLVLGTSSLADGGVMLHWMLFGTTPPDAAILDGSLAGGLALAALVATPVLMAFWFSPVLVAWRGMGPAQALFYSFFASLRNWRAFALYGATVAFVAFSLSLLLAGMVPLLKDTAMKGLIALLPVALVMLNVVMLPVLFSSFYFSFKDIFPDEQESDAPPPGENNDAT